MIPKITYDVLDNLLEKAFLKDNNPRYSAQVGYLLGQITFFAERHPDMKVSDLIDTIFISLSRESHASYSS